MAASPACAQTHPTADEVTSSLEKKLRCAVCDGIFDTDRRKPRLLRCRHSVCETCMLDLVKESSIITCGRCSVKTVVHGLHADALEVDECVKDLVQFLTPDRPQGAENVSHTLRSLRASVNSQPEDTENASDDLCDICKSSLNADSPFEFPHLDKSALFKYPCGHRCHRNCAVMRAKELVLKRKAGRADEQEEAKRDSINPDEQQAEDSDDDDDESLDPSMNPVLDRLAVTILPSLSQGDDLCAVCQRKLKSKSPYRDNVVLDRRSAVSLLFCNHVLHHNCAVMLVREKQESEEPVKCPCCTQPLGVKYGNQPNGGKMVINLQRNRRIFTHLASLPGFPNTDTIIIEYHFKPGIQGRNHPIPGERYEAYGFPRIAYLPLTPKGYEVLCMLKIAFDRGLIFTIGTSGTTGLANCVVWASIPHKTSTVAGVHGYPDPDYLDVVTEKLEAAGVTPDDIPDDPAESLGIGFEVDGTRPNTHRISDMEQMMWFV